MRGERKERGTKGKVRKKNKIRQRKQEERKKEKIEGTQVKKMSQKGEKVCVCERVREKEKKSKKEEEREENNSLENPMAKAQLVPQRLVHTMC